MKYADYIKQIEIDALWGGHKHILWPLDPHVNILSGINGVGKSTILNKVFQSICTKGDIINHLHRGASRCHACPLRHDTLAGQSAHRVAV